MNITAANLKGTPYENVRFYFVLVTEQLAVEWLKRNTKNRKLKEVTLDTYARDIKNDDWLTTHQGLAFNEDGDLIDGQNRLHALVRAKKAVLMVVSVGWPKRLPGKKTFTMDAVDVGCGRTLADQMELQHDIINSKFVAQTAGALAKLICGGFRASKKQSVSSILAVAGIYKDEFNWLGENVTVTTGLRTVHINGVMLLGLVVWPEKTKEFYNQLKTGLNLTATSPVYSLRQWLLTNRIGNSQDEVYKVRLATAHHLKLFVDGKTTGSLVTQSNLALLELLKLNGDRTMKVRALFELPEEKAAAPAAKPASRGRPARPVPAAAIKKMPATNGKHAAPPGEISNGGWKPFSPEAIELGRTRLHDPWTMTDLSALLDGGQTQVSSFIVFWRDQGWIERIGSNQYRKTPIFGKL